MPRESAAVASIRERVASGAVINADEASGRDVLHASYETKRGNHSVKYVAEPHHFAFAIDQSHLPMTLSDGRRILERYPVKSTPSGQAK